MDIELPDVNMIPHLIEEYYSTEKTQLQEAYFSRQNRIVCEK